MTCLKFTKTQRAKGKLNPIKSSCEFETKTRNVSESANKAAQK